MWFDKRLDAVCVRPLFFVVDIANQDRKTEPIQRPLRSFDSAFLLPKMVVLYYDPVRGGNLAGWEDFGERNLDHCRCSD